MNYAQLDENNIYIGVIEGIPGDVPNSWYAPKNSISIFPPTDEPGKWIFEDGAWTELTAEKKAVLIRQQRDALLLATDYMMMPDYPMSELARENLKVYRQALRDVPEQPDFPNSVVWPIKGE